MAVVSRSCARASQRYHFGRRLVVGCIPYRYRNGSKVEVLVITSQKGQGILFPKGGWEEGESVEEGACRETLEEAGVVGTIQQLLGNWRYKSKTQDKYHEGYMFPLLVTNQHDIWQEKGTRRRIWMDIDEARVKCRDWWMREALEKLNERLQHQTLSSSHDQANRAML